MISLMLLCVTFGRGGGGGEGEGSKKSIHWKSTAMPKSLGGIGFKDFLGFKKALLAK